jgi:hypothetical protein
MSATSTGITAAEASVPGAQSCEQTYAAVAEATAVIASVGRSTDDDEDPALDRAGVDIQLRLPTWRGGYTSTTLP